MEDEEDKKSGQGFIKEQTDKLKEKGKEQAKKHIRKKIIAFMVAHLATMLTHLLIPLIIAIIIITFFSGFLDIIGVGKSKEASEAKTAAVTYALGGGTEENSSSNNKSAIRISYNNGVYTISNSYSNDKSKLNEIKEKLTEIGIDVSVFTDFETGIIGALMENGLDINDYTTEELKCLPLFIKTEGCTRYLDLRPNSEKFDSQGNYHPQKLNDLKENEIPGVILVQRTNTSEEAPKYLEYINLSLFNDMVSQKNVDVLNYFTIDENNNLLVAKWGEYIKVEVDGEYPSGVEKTSEKEEYTINLEKIQYNEYVKKYTMPFDFLMQLLVISEEPDFCKELINIANDSKIVINIQEEETRRVEEDMQTYTVWKKEKKTVTYDASSSESGNTSQSNQNDKKESKTETSETSQPYNVKVTTTSIAHGYTVEIKEADTWIAHYIKEYKKPEKEISKEGPNQSSTKGNYGPSSTSTSNADGKTEKTETCTKIDETHSITTIIEKYPSDPNPTTSTHIYAKDENGSFEKFLSVYGKYAYTRDMMDSASAWLFDMMEENTNTTDLVAPVKYLLYVYDGTDHGVTEIDTSIFEPSAFISVVNNSNGISVGNDAQQKVVEVAKNSANYGIAARNGYCTEWVGEVYKTAGANGGPADCASHAGAKWGVSKDWSKIPLGATVFAYCTSSKWNGIDYGHIGIYIGNGMVAHNIGGVAIWDLDYWISYYNGVCWGWFGGQDLTNGQYPCSKTSLMPKIRHSSY